MLNAVHLNKKNFYMWSKYAKHKNLEVSRTQRKGKMKP